MRRLVHVGFPWGIMISLGLQSWLLFKYQHLTRREHKRNESCATGKYRSLVKERSQEDAERLNEREVLFEQLHRKTKQADAARARMLAVRKEGMLGRTANQILREQRQKVHQRVDSVYLLHTLTFVRAVSQSCCVRGINFTGCFSVL